MTERPADQPTPTPMATAASTLGPDDLVAIRRPAGRIDYAVVVDQGGRPAFQYETGQVLRELPSDAEGIDHVDVADVLALFAKSGSRAGWSQALTVASDAAQLPLDQRDLAYGHTLHGLTRGQIALRWVSLLRSQSPVRLQDGNPGPLIASTVRRGPVKGELAGCDLALSCEQCPNTEVVAGFLQPSGDRPQHFDWPSPNFDGRVHAKCHRCGAEHNELVSGSR